MAASLFRLFSPFAAYLIAAACLISWLGESYTWPIAVALLLGGIGSLVLGTVWMESRITDER